MLIGGNGQRDNIGYPMSVPSFRYTGEEIQSASWSEAAERGRIRLDLAAAYPDEAGIAVYTREFFVEKGKPIRMRDYIVLDEPQQLTWLFQTKRENGLRTEVRRGELGGAETMRTRWMRRGQAALC
ncbi:hypothetical protein [Paenibacillus sp. MBLB4367]|uniref:hypothetical protein n=1 Tax=Paenibacillus sp. MBLB4367 TaxID=3384767 RepID=UPI0039081668